MELDIMGLLGACSYALDCVEAELTHVATKHGKRVAYMSVCTAQKMGITGDALQDLAACSLLHDNALQDTSHMKQSLYYGCCLVIWYDMILNFWVFLISKRCL